MLVRGSWWGVDEEVVGARRPKDVGEKLSNHGCLFGPAPYNGRGARGEKEAEGH